MTYKLGFKTGLIAIVLSFFTVVGLLSNKVYAQNYNNGQYNNGQYYNDGNNYQQFYNDLAPYGQWYQDPQYGYVWAPNVGPNFRPYYSNGYWAMTEYGNMWISNYAWGWAAFHYGRWILSDYGWIWIPGNEWAPAWVSWRQGGGYYGWAPLGPGVSFAMSFGNNYYVPDPYWTFIPYGYIYNRSFSRYYSPRRTRGIRNNTTIINNTYVDRGTRNTYATGPRRSDVESRTGRRVQEYQVGTRNSAGAPSVRQGSVAVYRPKLESSRTAAPREVKQLRDPIAPRNTNSNVRERSNVAPVQRGTSTVERSTTPVERNAVSEQRNNNLNQNQRNINTQNERPVIQQPTRNNQIQTAPKNTPVQNRSEVIPVRRTAPIETRQQPTRTVTPQRESRQVEPQRIERSQPVERTRENTPSRSEEKSRRFR